MKGHNSLTLTQAAVCEAIEYWAKETVFKESKIRVIKVSAKSSFNNTAPEFEVTITDETGEDT